MGKRSGRDRDRDAAGTGANDGDRAGRAHRRLARELGRLEKRLNRARSQEARRLRQLDEAAADVVRLEADLRRLQAELAGATVAQREGAAETGAPGPGEAGGQDEDAGPVATGLTAQAAGLQAELARLEGRIGAVEAEWPPEGVDRAAAADVAPAGAERDESPELPAAPAETAGEAAASWSDWLATAEAGMPAGGIADHAWTAPARTPDVRAEPEPEPGLDVPAPPAGAWHEAPRDEPSAGFAISAEPEADQPGLATSADDWPSVIHLGAGASAPSEPRSLAAADLEPGLEAAPEAGLGVAAEEEGSEAPEPTARSWPQRSRQRAGS